MPEADKLWDLLTNDDHFEQGVEILHMFPELAARLVERVRVEFDPGDDFIEMKPSLRVACALAEHAPLNVHRLTVGAADEGLEGLRYIRGLKALHVWGPGAFDPTELRELEWLECIGAAAVGRPGPRMDKLTAQLDPGDLAVWADLSWLALTLTRQPSIAELQVLTGPYRWLGLGCNEPQQLLWVPPTRALSLSGFSVQAGLIGDLDTLEMTDGAVQGELLRLSDRCRRASFDEDVDLPPKLVLARSTQLRLAGQQVKVLRR